MDWQAGTRDGTGGQPGPGRWRPPPWDPHLAGFLKGGDWDGFPPSADLARALEAACGKDLDCPGARHAELIGLLRQWEALENWAVAGKLGVLRALIDDDDLRLPGDSRPGGLPDWSKSLTREVALALGMSAITADKIMWTAWDLKARLPGIGQRLADGKLTLAKARAVDDALAPLSQEDVIMAEELVLDRLAQEPTMTYGQLEKAATWAAILMDPEAATRRREGAEEDNARVIMFRESSGAAGLSGRDLPTDQTLTANVRVGDRAQQYKDSGAFPGTRMGQLCAIAYLDLLNDITAEQRITFARATAGSEARADEPGPDDPGPADGAPDAPNDGPDGGPADGGSGPAGPDPDRGGPGVPGPGEPEAGAPCCPCRECDGTCNPPTDDDSDPGPAADDDLCPGSSPADDDLCPGGGPDDDIAPADDHATAAPEDRPAFPPRLTDLVTPLVTLFGWEERPGESHGFGPLDPALCRSLAALAAASPYTRICLTITTDDGIAIGHGCARAAPGSRPGSSDRAGPAGPRPTLPARLNITITADQLAGLPATAAAPPCPGGWSLTRSQGPPGGSGTWTLTVPGGRKLTLALEPVPTFTCDHRHESHAYQPNDTLRHLVQIRDRTCTLPICSRHARECDFEHAIPYHQGGRTCACNAGARSRACHQVKQAKGWTVITQPAPGWHQWQTPSGRVYTQGPYHYPT